MQAQTPDGHTTQAASNMEGFEGIRTPSHQGHCHQEIELSAVDTAREGQTSERLHSSQQIKFERPSKRWDRGSSGDRQPTGTIATNYELTHRQKQSQPGPREVGIKG